MIEGSSIAFYQQSCLPSPSSLTVSEDVQKNISKNGPRCASSVSTLSTFSVIFCSVPQVYERGVGKLNTYSANFVQFSRFMINGCLLR